MNTPSQNSQHHSSYRIRRRRSSLSTSAVEDTSSHSQHELQVQETIPADEIIDSIASASDNHNSSYHRTFDEDFGVDDQHLIDEDEEAAGEHHHTNGNVDHLQHGDNYDEDDDMGHMNSNTPDQPTLEQIQRVYYTRGLEELESLQLLDLSPLANWKLSSYKQGCGIAQLRDDSPDTLWQSDGSNGNNNNANNPTANGLNNNQLTNPHTVTIQFSKKISLERISIFTNFSLDESYTPSKIRIMAGSSGWDLSEVCTVSFNKPIGWSHIIFNGIRNDGVLKCFVVKLIILANHQDGKDSHIRAIRCFGKKSSNRGNVNNSNSTQPSNPSILPINASELDTSYLSGYTNNSGVSLNNRFAQHEQENTAAQDMDESLDGESNKILGNVTEVIGFNSGFQSLELRSISSIR